VCSGASVDDVDSNQNADLDSNESGYSTNSESETEQERYSFDLRFNNAIREVFLGRFVQIFVAYEQFVILPNKVRPIILLLHPNLYFIFISSPLPFFCYSFSFFFPPQRSLTECNLAPSPLNLMPLNRLLLIRCYFREVNGSGNRT